MNEIKSSVKSAYLNKQRIKLDAENVCEREGGKRGRERERKRKRESVRNTDIYIERERENESNRDS